MRFFRYSLLLILLLIKAAIRNWPLITLCLLVYALVFSSCVVIDAPWAIPWPGKPTLTGSWVGPLRSKSGADYRVFLSLGLGKMWSELGPADQLEGFARVCARSGAEHRLEIGGAADRSGSRVSVRALRYRGEILLKPFILYGSWHDDRLELRGGDNPFNPATGALWTEQTWSASPGTSDWEFEDFVVGALRKGRESDYQAECRTLAGR